VKEDDEAEEAEEKQGHTGGGGAPMEEEEEEEEGLLDRRKVKNRPSAPAAKEDDSDTEEMDELDLGPTLPIALPTEAEREGGDDDDDMLPTLPIARDYDDDVPTYKANVDKGKGKDKGDAEEEEEGTEEIDELDLLPTLPIFEYQQAKQTKGPPRAKSESDTANKQQQERKNDHEDIGEEEDEDEGYNLPTLAMDHAYSAKKSEARRVEDDEEGDTEEMEEEEGDDLNATLPIPEYAEPTMKPKKPTPLASAPATATTKQAGKQEDEDSGTEEMDEVDLLPTLPIVGATTMTEAKSSSSLMGKRKREVSKEEESSGTEPLSDVDAPLPTREDKLPANKGAAATASQQPLAKKQKPEPTTAKAKDSEVLGKLCTTPSSPLILDRVRAWPHLPPVCFIHFVVDQLPCVLCRTSSIRSTSSFTARYLLSLKRSMCHPSLMTSLPPVARRHAQAAATIHRGLQGKSVGMCTGLPI
jgi:hypothetical protein